MHIRRFGKDYSRRHFVKAMAQGVLATGVLKPLWPTLAATGEHTAAYPDELLSLDAYTGGRISEGHKVTADNVALVRDLLDPIQAMQIAQLGRELSIVPQTHNLYRLNPHDYIEATLRNAGRARFDATGNVVTEAGKPWIGGNPFPDPKSGVEVFAAATLSWGRHDVSLYAVEEKDLDPKGRLAYEYEAVWVEHQPVARITLDPKPYQPGHKDKLRYQTILFVTPKDVRGTSFLNIWPYDQNQFPDLYGYLPAFKRVRRFPTNQRFEPLITGNTLYLSDAWAAGDPFLTWGNYRIVHRGPYLAPVADSWNPAHPNWRHGTHGGAKGLTFWNTEAQLVPEAIVVEAEPIRYPRAPVSRKRVWFDARTLTPLTMVSFDRRGEIFKSFDGAFSLYDIGGRQVLDGARPYWSWTRVHAFNVQTNRMTRLEQVREISGGYRMRVNDPSLYNKFLTVSALRRLGD
ncbi:MAG: DUF1329 domain-containing protein [Gammaproteobacteria bacterium]|nr:DUF1329 domain-containing protein [Gammaproteobacteria bacterium]